MEQFAFSAATDMSQKGWEWKGPRSLGKMQQEAGRVRAAFLSVDLQRQERRAAGGVFISDGKIEDCPLGCSSQQSVCAGQLSVCVF